MGKKAKSSSGIAKAATRKIDKSTLPPPPPPPAEEYGSSKPLADPSLPGSGFKILDGSGYDDGGVADLSLLIDLDDNVQRRRRGDAEYFTALKADLLPRANKGQLANLARRDQKVHLAQILFSEDDQAEDKGPSEVFIESTGPEEDQKLLAHRRQRVAQAKAALKLSLLLREPACASLSLSELCKRRLALNGKEGAADALRCAEKALGISQDGFWDGDEVAVEAEEDTTMDPKYERNATTPGLSNPTVLKHQPLRVSYLCQRSALLQRGNALAAMGKHEAARESYVRVFPLLEKEPRCARVDWERHSLYINIGNTYSRSGDFNSSDEQFKQAEKLGNAHLDNENGSKTDGGGMVNGAKRARAFALKKAGKEGEAKALLTQVIATQMKLDEEEAAKKRKESEEAAAAQKQ